MGHKDGSFPVVYVLSEGFDGCPQIESPQVEQFQAMQKKSLPEHIQIMPPINATGPSQAQPVLRGCEYESN